MIHIGKNAQNNWELIDRAQQNDIWFHIENEPSCHVIIESNNNIIPKNIIYKAALECKKHSKFKKLNNISIIYTPIHNIKKGIDIGSVYIINHKLVKKVNA
jgi:predicted ribosome quality control (RQC) complex YloA/Tae2 family protein